jgi:hypothetical protein
MALISVSELISDTDFAQCFFVARTTGAFSSAGVFTTNTVNLKTSGIIQPEQTREMDMTPQGDEIRGNIHIWTTCELFTTFLAQNQWQQNYISDQITWRGTQWKILSVQNFLDFGMYKSQATRIVAA